jgi:hypothetical protein
VNCVQTLKASDDEEVAEKKKAVKRLESGDPIADCADLKALLMLGKRSQPKLTIEVEGWEPISGVQVDQRDWISSYVLKPTWQDHPVRMVVAVVEKGGTKVRCAFFGRNLHSRMPLDPTHVRLKRTCVCPVAFLSEVHSSYRFTL